MTPVRRFGTTSDGQAVTGFDLTAGDLAVTLLDRGAVVQDVRLAGVGHSLTIGSDRLADYEGEMAFCGALIGPVANRLRGASATIAGRLHRFTPSLAAGHLLHSGPNGSHARPWQVVEHGTDHLALRLDLPAGEDGLPGNRVVEARFSVHPPATLRMQVTATTDAPTLMNFANHSYWNLDGAATWAGHRLRIAADRMLPTDADVLPTGEVRDVTGTPYDLRAGSVPEPGKPPLDHNFCLADGRQPLRDVLWLTGTTGVRMVLATTEPGLQIYDGRKPIRPGGVAYAGLAVEAQGWPDAPNHAGFPSITLGPGETYAQITQWRFERG